MANSPSAKLIRHSHARPCSVCAGYQALRRHEGIRCAGFTVGPFVYCTRDELAGGLPLDISTEPPAYRHLVSGSCRCGREHGGWTEPRAFEGGPRALEASLPLQDRHAIYQTAIELLGLRPAATQDLRRRGLLPSDIDSIGYRSVPLTSEKDRFIGTLVDQFGETLLRLCPGFTDKHGRTDFWQSHGDGSFRDGYIVPYRNEAGLVTGLQLKRLDTGSYETARLSHGSDLYHIAGSPAPGSDIFVTEGGLKAQVSHRLGGVTVMGLPGQSLAREHLVVLKSLLPGRVIEALDHEANDTTDRVRAKWHRELPLAGLRSLRAVWEGSDVGGPKGLDDLFAAGGRPRLRELTFIPPEMGAKRPVRPATARGRVDQGVSQAEARRLTRDAVGHFVRETGRRR